MAINPIVLSYQTSELSTSDVIIKLHGYQPMMVFFQ
jgi:hypothetical protein